MTQQLVLSKLTQYLKITSQDYLAELDRRKGDPAIAKLKNEHIEYIGKLKDSMTYGKCFGFSLSSAAMELSGKLNWWEHALVAVANWDGSSTALDKEVILPDARTTQRLKDIFNRVLNYVVFNSCINDYDRFFTLEGMNQLSALLPTAHVLPMLDKRFVKVQSYFDFLDNDGNIRTVKHQEKISGYFSKEALDKLLDAETLRDSLCLVHSMDHTIRIAFNGKDWMLYDPNYDHTRLNTIHRTGTKKEIIDEICIQLGNYGKTFEFASFSENKQFSFPYYQMLVNSASLSLIKEDGLSVLVKELPQCLDKLFNRWDTFKDKSAVRAAIAVAIGKWCAVTKSSSLILLAMRSPQTLSRICKLADTSPEGLAISAAIGETLSSAEEGDKANGLHVLASRAPALLGDLSRLANESKELRQGIASALSAKNSANWTGLRMVAICAPASLPDFIHILLTTRAHISSLKLIVESLFAVDNVGFKAWERVQQDSLNEVVTVLFNHLAKMDNYDLHGFEKILLSRPPVVNVNNRAPWITFYNSAVFNLEKTLLDRTRILLNQTELKAYPQHRP